VEIVKEDPIFAMVNRKHFDQSLITYAINHGAEFREKMKVIDVTVKPNHVLLTLDDGSQLKSSLIIGADGFLSTVARKTGLLDQKRGHGVSIFEEFPLSKEEIKHHFKEEGFCHVYSKLKGMHGCGWVFPKKDLVNIGLVEYEYAQTAAQKGNNLKTDFEQFLSLLKSTGIIPKNLQSTHAQGGVLPFRPLQRTYADRVLLCGDAAGFINPVSGEGIHYAITSGEIAASIASQALKKNNCSQTFLSLYEKHWMNAFGKEIMMMLRSKKQWRKDGEKTIKLMCTDEKFAELLFLTMTGKESMYELRWKILRRYFYVYLKHLFGRNRHTLQSI
jgi:flavin-dependent dehydrogenase